jgi:hypothetical protein
MHTATPMSQIRMSRLLPQPPRDNAAGVMLEFR